MVKNTLSKCPVCDSDLVVTRLYCVNCDTTIEVILRLNTHPLGISLPSRCSSCSLSSNCEGRLNRMEDEMNLSYPTLRSRLTEIVRALGYEPGKDEGPIALSAEERREILDRLDRGEISWEEAQARLRGEKYVQPATTSNKEGK